MSETPELQLWSSDDRFWQPGGSSGSEAAFFADQFLSTEQVADLHVRIKNEPDLMLKLATARAQSELPTGGYSAWMGVNEEENQAFLTEKTAAYLQALTEVTEHDAWPYDIAQPEHFDPRHLLPEHPEDEEAAE